VVKMITFMSGSRDQATGCLQVVQTPACCPSGLRPTVTGTGGAPGLDSH
jgi:hypothetical protein